jgi:NAD(P)-dependent dehydrogenase (short-subunit alcohol dehydrogenase family)
VDLELTGRRAVVTGGSRGIGLAIGRALAAEGADVALVARTEDVLRRAADEVARESGRQVIAVPADTGDDASVATMVGLVVAQLGGVDILVNAAATPATGAPFTDDDLEAEINVKVRGYLRCARAVAPLMVESGWGRIVNIAGLATRQTGNLVGTVRNVAVAALTKNLADELGPHGINVTVVHPGLTRTERTAALVQARAAAQGTSEEAIEKQMAEGNSIRHLVDAREVADVVVFLCSPKSVAINGDAIAAGGGAPRAIHY